jgi:hypothetical protein
MARALAATRRRPAWRRRRPRPAGLAPPSLACPAQQQGKPLCFYFPSLRCGYRRLPLLAAPAPGLSAKQHRLPPPPSFPPPPPFPLPAPAGVGYRWLAVASAGQQRRRLRARRCSGTCSRCWLRRRRVSAPAPASVTYTNKKAMLDIKYRGVVVQPTSHYAQDTGFKGDELCSESDPTHIYECVCAYFV